MRILAFDLASRCGVADGDAFADRPRTTIWTLRGEREPLELASRNMGCRLRDRLSLGDVDEVWVEDFMDPTAHPSSASIKIAIGLRNAVEAVTACYDVPVRAVSVSQARIAFCGKATAHPARRPGAPPKPDWLIARERQDTKQMVWRAAVRHGYFDAGAPEDFDRSDAVCIWSWGATKRGRTPPLVLT